MLAHEMGHERNGDATNGLLIGTAVATLDRWRDIVTPQKSVVASTGFYALAELIARVLMHLLQGLVRLIRALLIGLANRASPVSEYIADRVAVQLAGPAAVISLLEMTTTAPVCMAAARIAVRKDGINPWATERATLAKLPAEGRAKLLAESKARGDRVDDTHPAMWRRIEVVQAMAGRPLASAGDDAVGGSLAVTAGDAVDAELATLDAVVPAITLP